MSTIKAGHDVMITHPNELAEILLLLVDKMRVFTNEKTKNVGYACISFQSRC